MRWLPTRLRSVRPRTVAALALAALLGVSSNAPVHGQVALRRDLVIDADFGFVTAVAVDRAGRIYVADDQAQRVLSFDPAGGGQRVVGGRGAGPGEFQGIQALVVGRGDTLYAFDPGQRRITAFAPGPDRRVAYTVGVQNLGGELASQQLLVPSRGPFLLTFTTPFGTQAVPGSPPGERALTLRTVDRRGAVGATPVMRAPDRDALVTRRGRSVSVSGLPYGRASFFALAPGDRLYHGWNDEPDLTVHDLRGRRVGAVGTRASRLPVSEGDTRMLLESYSPESPQLEDLRLAIREGRVPATKPAFKSMLVDDAGRLWVNVTTTEDVVVLGGNGLIYTSNGERGADSPSPWWVFDATGRRVAIYTVPVRVQLREVRGGRAYGIDVDEYGVHRIVRYVVAP